MKTRSALLRLAPVLGILLFNLVWSAAHGGWAAVTGVALGSAVGFLFLLGVARRQFRPSLTLSPTGIETSFVQGMVSWADVAGIHRRRGVVVTEDVFRLERPLVHPRWAVPGSRTRDWLPLALFDPHWRTGPIGSDIRRWAPRLLGPAAPDT